MMLHAVSSESRSVNPQNLAELNLLLTRFHIGPVDKTKLEQVLQTEPRERIVKALNLAVRDARAQSYLARHFGRNLESHEEKPGGAGGKMTFAPGYHVYGGKGALCFEPDQTRSGVRTICIDAADARGDRQYDWAHKLRLQLTAYELLHFAAVLFGFRKKCEGRNHGPDKSKGFTLEDQGDKLFLRIFAKGQSVKAVPISPDDAFYIAQLFLVQLRGNSPDLTGNEILLTLQRVHAARQGRD